MVDTSFDLVEEIDLELVDIDRVVVVVVDHIDRVHHMHSLVGQDMDRLKDNNFCFLI